VVKFSSSIQWPTIVWMRMFGFAIFLVFGVLAFLCKHAQCLSSNVLAEDMLFLLKALICPKLSFVFHSGLFYSHISVGCVALSETFVHPWQLLSNFVTMISPGTHTITMAGTLFQLPMHAFWTVNWDPYLLENWQILSFCPPVHWMTWPKDPWQLRPHMLLVYRHILESV